MIQIGLVDDHKLFRSGLRALITAFEKYEVVMEAGNGQEFINQLPHHNLDVVLMDLEMPVMDGLATIKILKEEFPKIKVIIVSMHSEEKFIAHLMELGARGYLLKNANPEDIDIAIQSVSETGYYFTEMVSQVLLHGLVKREKVKPTFNILETLTARETEIVKLICKEYTTPEMADKLFLSPRTIEGHRNSIMEKTHARNTAGIVVFAMKNGLYEE
ncbi:MAG TPA: response regulator transcription factor [Bacteroidia bacterium]|nr:response regulator transcription factor [Bacteroidia bacterium]